MDDRIKKMLEQIDQIEKLSNPLSSLTPKPSILDLGYDHTGRILNERSAYAEVLRQNDFASSAVKGALGDSYYYDAVTGLSKRPDGYTQLSEAVHGALPHNLISATVDAVSAAKNAMGLDSAAYATMFRLPEESEVQKLAAAAALGAANIDAASYIGAVGLADKMAAMHSPWLNKQSMLESVNAFSALQNIGYIANSNAPFDDLNSKNLRGYLGDWRDDIAVSAERLLDTKVRTDYYKDRGFNPQLTQFTEEAFEEGLDVARLVKKSAKRPTQEQEIGDPDDDANARNVEAYRLLYNFEATVRYFIEDKMSAKYGHLWMKQNVPEVVLKRWIERKEDSEKREGPNDDPLIYYSDFSDHVAIIERKDNWESIFRKIFVRKESIKESFTRLTPVRNTVMHSRPVTRDDKMYLVSETTRVLKAIELDSEYAEDD